MSANKEEKDTWRIFERLARFECEKTACKGQLATKVVERRHQDGDYERRMLCDKHAAEQQRFWSSMDWDTDVAVSDIEEWKFIICHGGRTVTRVGNKYRPGKGDTYVVRRQLRVSRRHQSLGRLGVMRQKVLTGVEEAIQNLVNHGVVRPTGENRNGQMVYAMVPDAELSDEASAYKRSLEKKS